MKKLEIEALNDNLDTVTEFIDELLEEAGCGMNTQLLVDLCVEEIFVNIASYAYAPDVGMAWITAEILQEPKRIRIAFSDTGMQYDPLANEDPDITLSAEERKIGGLGVFLVKKNMDSVRYEYTGGHNILTVEKNL